MRSTEWLPVARLMRARFAPWQEARHRQVWVTLDVRKSNRLHSVCRCGILQRCIMTGIPKRTIFSRRHGNCVSRLSLSTLGEETFGGWLITPTKRDIRDRSSSSCRSMITFTSFHLKSAGKPFGLSRSFRVAKRQKCIWRK